MFQTMVYQEQIPKDTLHKNALPNDPEARSEGLFALAKRAERYFTQQHMPKNALLNIILPTSTLSNITLLIVTMLNNTLPVDILINI